MKPDEMMNIIEHEIVRLQNDEYSDPQLVRELLDLEGEIVLAEYYASPEYAQVEELDRTIIDAEWYEEG